jgi:hypothetical protein
MKPNLRGAVVPVRSRSSHRRRERLNVPGAAQSRRTPEEYHVGPGHPPKEHQFKPGQSGNPKGAKRKPSLAPDLKAVLERALNEKVQFKRDEQETIMSKAAAAIHKLVNDFAEGDRHARRDLILLADKLGVDLTAGQLHVIEQALAPTVTADDQALVDDYVRRRWADLNNAESGSDLGHSTSDDPNHDKVAMTKHLTTRNVTDVICQLDFASFVRKALETLEPNSEFMPSAIGWSRWCAASLIVSM